MQAFEEESKRVLKKQRLCVAQIDAQLDFLLEEVAITKQQLVEKQDEYRRKKSRSGHAHDASDSSGSAHGVDATERSSELVDVRPGSSSEGAGGTGTIGKIDSETEEEEKQESEDGKDSLLLGLARAAREKEREDEGEPAHAEHSGEHEKDLRVEPASAVVEEEESEMDNVLQGFIHRVRLLNVEKNVVDELKSIHVALSKYAKQIDKVTCRELVMIHALLDWGCQLTCHFVLCRLFATTSRKCVDPSSSTTSSCADSWPSTCTRMDRSRLLIRFARYDV